MDDFLEGSINFHFFFRLFNHLSIGMRMVLIETIVRVAIIVSVKNPAPAIQPTAELHQTVAAVVNP
jgi:hypothetical protein